MRLDTGLLTTCSVPPGRASKSTPSMLSATWRLIEATSKEGRGVSACLRGEYSSPATTGAAITPTTAALNKNFLLKSNFRAAPGVMIRTILFFKSAPVTPDTQASGDPTQNSQIFKILSA